MGPAEKGRPPHVPRALWWHAPRGTRRRLSRLDSRRSTPDKFDVHGTPIRLAAWVFLLDQTNYSRVAKTTIGPYLVSTVWLGLNHNHWGNGPPLIFETMVFRGVESTGAQYRYATLKEARRGHGRAVQEVRRTLN